MKKINKDTNEKAITLITLIVTIVISAILAGVTLSTLLDEDGLYKLAQTEIDMAQMSIAKEKIKLEVAGSKKENGEYVAQNVKNSILSHIDNSQVLGETFTLTTIVDGHKFRIDSNGKVRELNGEIITKTITFNANGGAIPVSSNQSWEGSGQIATKIIEVGSIYGELPIPIREGYTFNGWALDYNSANYITSNTNVGNNNNNTLYAIWGGNELTFANQEIKKTYSPSSQIASIVGATNGTGAYTYVEKIETNSNQENTNYISITETTITIANNTPIGIYTYVVTATDSGSGIKKDATITITIGIATLEAPSNISINTDGQITWDNVANATGYEISTANNIWINVASGDATIDTYTTGTKTVLVRAITTNTNYNEKGLVGEASAEVYSLTLTAGAGISVTSGAGNYVAGKQISIDATVSTGYTWSTWTKISGTELQNATTKNTTITISANTVLLATTTANELMFANQEINKTYSTSSQTANIIGASNGTGAYTYIEKTETNANQENTNYISIAGTTITIADNTPIGAYTYVVTATDSGSGIAKDATITIIIGKATLETPSNISINVDAQIIWDNVTNATGYEISTSNNIWTEAVSGSATIDTNTTGTKTVQVRAITTNTNYNEKGTVGEASAEVYSLTLTAGTGISATSGAGNFVAGKQISIDATVSTGYTWSTWTRTSGTEPQNATTKNTLITISANTVLVAIATVNSYTLTVNANGGTIPPTSGWTITNENLEATKNVTYGEIYGTLPTPTKEGHEFNGWYTAQSGGTQIIPSTTVSIIANQTLYAHWTSNAYTVEYYSGGTKLGESSHFPGIAKNLTAYSGTPPTGGYTFAGWSTTNNGLTINYNDSESITDIALPRTTIALYAVYSRSLTVTFHITADVPRTPTTVKTQYFNPTGNTSTELTVVLMNILNSDTKTGGYIFAGWCSDSATNNFVGVAGAEIPLTNNMELYTKWQHIDPTEITVTKYGTGQIRLDNIPQNMTVRVWTPTRYVNTKQRNPMYCQGNTPNLILNASHNTSQNYISKTSLPSTYTDIYMELEDAYGNVFSLYYCDLTSVTSNNFTLSDPNFVGEVYVSSVSVVTSGCSNVVRKSNTNSTAITPVINSDGTIDFDLAFKVPNSNSATYIAQYNIVITNDSIYDFEYYQPSYTPTCYGNNTRNWHNDKIQYNIAGINTGDIILSGSQVTATLFYTFDEPTQSSNASGYIYVIDKDSATMDMTENVVENSTTRLTATITDQEGDLTGNKTRATYNIQVTNEFDIAKKFNLAVLENEKFKLVDEYGQENPEYTIAASTTNQTYTFYLEKATGAEYGVNQQRPMIVFTPSGSDSLNIGRVTTLVDVNTTITDIDPPLVSDATIIISNTPGEATVQWEGEDTISGVVINYFVDLHKSDGTYIDTYETGNDITNLTVTGLEENFSYYVIVYGQDIMQNKANSNHISNANQNQGFATKSADVEARWVFNGRISRTNVTCSNYSDNFTINRGDTFEGTFTRTEDQWSTIETTMGGQAVAREFDTSQKTSTMTIKNVTGDLQISISSKGNQCLVEGTPVLLANGSYKNIEDIEYTDLLAVYDHEHGGLVNVYPLWIEIAGEASQYEKITFSDGSILKISNSHCLFDVDEKKYIDIFENSKTSIGRKVYKYEDGELKVVSITNIELVDEPVKYYNVVATKYYNIIANGFLTEDILAQLSNIYGYGDNAIYSPIYTIISNGNHLKYDDVSDFMPHYLFEGLNFKNAKLLMDNNELDVELLIDYLSRKTIYPINKEGKLYFKVTTSLDDWSNPDSSAYLHEEGSKYILPTSGAEYFVETTTGAKYKPGDEIEVNYSMHFETDVDISSYNSIFTKIVKSILKVFNNFKIFN